MLRAPLAHSLTPRPVYLNQDMIGSLNAIHYVFDGTTAPPDVRKASAGITQLYAASFSKRGANHSLSAFPASMDFANSDWGAFVFGGVPSGGSDTGASERKSMAERARFGGWANTPCDACYHQPCDGLANVNVATMTLHAQCTAEVLAQLAVAPNVRAYLEAAAAGRISPGSTAARAPRRAPRETM